LSIARIRFDVCLKLLANVAVPKGELEVRHHNLANMRSVGVKTQCDIYGHRRNDTTPLLRRPNITDGCVGVVWLPNANVEWPFNVQLSLIREDAQRIGPAISGRHETGLPEFNRRTSSVRLATRVSDVGNNGRNADVSASVGQRRLDAG
jgi:hypothetical protein